MKQLAKGSHPAPKGAAADWREQLVTKYKTFNAFVTAVTGKPHIGQQPFFTVDGGIRWFGSLSVYALSQTSLITVLLAIDANPAGNFWLSLAAALATVVVVGSLRIQQVAYGHHAVHNELSKRWPWLNKVAQVICTAMPLAQNAEDYKNDHIRLHHKQRKFATLEDPDAKLLAELGFRHGMKKADLLWQVAKTLLSPTFHVRFMMARARSSFVTSSVAHRVTAAVWLGALVSLAFVLPFWVWIAGIVVPYTVGYQASALLQFSTEHRWLMPEGAPTDSQGYMERCAARFCLVPPPSPALKGISKFFAWTKWSMRMIPELLIRIGVTVGDLPWHDWHHGSGFLKDDPKDWTHGHYERQRHIDDNDDAFGLAKREHYGLLSALYWAFDARD